VTMRDRGAASPAAFGAAAQPGHLGRGTGLINEDQVLRVEIGLGVEPRLTPRSYVGPFLLAGVRRFF
jgi:hypothetical protein